MQLTVEQLARGTKGTIANAFKYHQHLNDGMRRFGISTPRQVAAFLATLGIESAHLTTTEESLFYRDPARLAKIYKRAFGGDPAKALPYIKNSRKLSELLYQGYHGRGLIQLTWLKNYEAASAALGYDYVRTPEIVCQPLHAALTACWFWHKTGCNEAAEADDMEEVTRLVNGPAKMHLAERTTLYAMNTELLGVA